MLTRKDVPRLLLAGLKTIYDSAYKSVTPVYTQITTEVQSNKSKEEYGWLGATPALREWIDERAPKGIKENGFDLKNKDFEASIEVDRNAIEDDQYGQIKVRVQQMGVQAAKGFDKFLAATIEANGLAYDGQNFFDTDHPNEDGTTQSNFYTGSARAWYVVDLSQGVSPFIFQLRKALEFVALDSSDDIENFMRKKIYYGVDGRFAFGLGDWTLAAKSKETMNADNIEKVITNMRAITDETGMLKGVNPTHIIVHASDEFTAKKLLDPTVVAVTNDPAAAVLKGALKVIVLPYLTGA